MENIVLQTETVLKKNKADSVEQTNIISFYAYTQK